MKKVTAFVLVIAMLIFSCSITASAALIGGEGGYYYSLKSNKTATLEEYHGNDKELAIPSSVYSYSVTTIAENTFSNNTNIETVDIPKSIKYVGAYAFYGCTSLQSVAIPNSVTEIKAATFYGCSNLTDVYIPVKRYEDRKQRIQRLPCENHR